MKRKILMTLLVLFSVFTLACGCEKNKEEVLDTNETENKIETLTVYLDNGEDKDYSWDYTLTNEGIISIEKKIINNRSIYEITPVSSGSTEVTFQLSKMYEAQEDPMYAKYEINVDENLVISELHYGKYYEEEAN